MKTSLKLALVGSLTLLAPAAAAQAPTFDRAVACAGGVGFYGWGPERLVLDAAGNTFVAGRFNGTVPLGNALLTAVLPPGPNSVVPNDNFLAKLDPAGRYAWAVQLGDGQDAYVTALATDAGGDLYATGTFRSFRLQLGAGGSVLFNSSSRADLFVARFDGATGRCRWARRAGGLRDDGVSALAVAPNGTVWLAGGISTIPGIPSGDVGPFAVAGPFLARLDLAGTWVGVEQLDSGSGWVGIGRLLPDAQGNVYAVGNFGGTSLHASRDTVSVRLGATTLSTRHVPASMGGNEVFVAKANAAGTWRWAVQGDGAGQQNMAWAGAATLDATGHLYIGGSYQSTAVRLGSTVLPNMSQNYPTPNYPPNYPYLNSYDSDAFVARLDTATGAWQWANRSGGPGYEGLALLGVDGAGRVYAVGNLALGTGGTNVARLDTASGAFANLYSIDETPPLPRIYGRAFDAQGRLSIAGYFDGPTATFGAFTVPGLFPNSSTGYVARLAAGPLAARAPAPPAPALAAWPNPAPAGSVVQVGGVPPGTPVQLLDALGRTLSNGGTVPTSGTLALPLPSGLPPGVYLLRAGGRAARLAVE